MNKKELLFNLLDKFDLNAKQKEKIFIFVEEFFIYNQKVNLTAIKDYQQFLDKNIYDSLLILKFEIIKEQKIILDIGTGGGFPGLLLALIYDQINFILVDSVRKKTDWLNYIIEKLKLNNIKVINKRIENLKEWEEKIDLILVRAVAKVALLLEISTFLLRKNGLSVFYKGKNYLQELKMTDNNFLKKRGVKLKEIYHDQLNNQNDRYFLIYQRTNLNFKNRMIDYKKIKKII
ncbi:MAG: ribosomal RNA small subunit methyltransferase G [Candidatus Hepatoplasma scabrum]|nr:MAG: ribosomal RNA small subunit methyltransferase G [Candidatus Hepatoplasma sp.]